MLNKEFLEALEAEWASGARSNDWSAAVRDYISHRDSLRKDGAPAKSGAATGAGTGAAVAAPASGLFGAAAPAPAPPVAGGMFTFGGGAAPAAAAPAAPAGGLFSFGTMAAPPSVVASAPPPAAAAPAMLPPAAAAEAPSAGATADDADVRFQSITKLAVYRAEKRNEEGELVQEKGWKAIGKGQLRLLRDENVHFLEFRPEVSEGTGSQEPEEEMVAGKVRFGRPNLSARLRVDTKFETASKKSAQVNLHSANAAGEAVFARYNITFADPAQVAEFVALATGCLPSA